MNGPKSSLILTGEIPGPVRPRTPVPMIVSALQGRSNGGATDPSGQPLPTVFAGAEP
jgi:hypothetical protein